MKCILPLITALLTTSFAIAQNPDYSGTDLWDGSLPAHTIHDDGGLIGGVTRVSGTIFRINGVTYNHTNQTFQVVTGSTNGWLTQFNDLLSAGDMGNNADYFLFQGNNTIVGSAVFSTDPGSIIMFDDLYFNIGAGNTMNIINHNGVYVFGDREYYAVPPGGIVVAKSLHFNNGITTTNRDFPVDGAIVLVNSAGYVNTTGTPTDAQHVNGFVTEYNNANSSTGAKGHGGNFTYPVGNGSSVYQLLRSGTFDDEYYTLTVGWVDGDPNTTADFTGNTGYLDENYNTTGLANLGADIAAVATVGFWDWHYQDETDLNYTALGMSDDQTITVSIPDLSGYTGSAKEDLRLVGWNANISRWINLSVATPGATGLTKGSTLVGTIPAGTVITALAVGSASILLPVTFKDFTVKAQDCKALLEWKTSMEQNNSHFLVEHSSNGVQFTTIARVTAVGNSNTEQTYNYNDEAPLSGANYYRITQVDFDGKQTSTPIRLLQVRCAADAAFIKAYPNPASNQLFIKSGKAVAQVNVLSSSGQNVLKFIPSGNQGGLFTLNIQSIQRGIYLVQVVNKDGSADIIKVMKK